MMCACPDCLGPTMCSDGQAVVAERDRLRKALDAAMQYVPPKDRAWIDAIVKGQ